MVDVRPGNIAIRVANQYRRRDVLTYLALRYYLENSAARRDHWCRDVAVDLVLTRPKPVYFEAQHFKEFVQGKVKHRTMFIPCANEALAEASLLEECSLHAEFANPKCVYSYSLSDTTDRKSVFMNYFAGLQRRQQEVAVACKGQTNAVVRYLDIEKFYPSISIDLAKDVWKKTAYKTKLSGNYSDLGAKLLADYGESTLTAKPAILTGPMFSHLVANLVLREIDEYFQSRKDVQYFRYVDDVVFVGARNATMAATEELRARLNSLGLTLHAEGSPKNIEVSSGKWLEGENDFTPMSKEESWLNLIRDVRAYLLKNPQGRSELIDRFRSVEMRVPVRDYGSVVKEQGYLEWARLLLMKTWFRKKTWAVTIESIIDKAIRVQTQHANEFYRTLDGCQNLGSYDRKRRVTKLRFHLSRLVYLASPEALKEMSGAGAEIPELIFHTAVSNAVATGRIDSVLSMGTNVSQAVAQPLRAAGGRATTEMPYLTETASQSIAIFAFNGVPVDAPSNVDLRSSALAKFAFDGVNIDAMKQADPFLREIACLHGIGDRPRHAEMFERAMDEDEVLAVDAIDQLNESESQ